MKRVVQTYKSSGHWKNGHPGVGDFLRGTCMLFETVKDSSLELRVDVSRSDMCRWIQQDPALFCTTSADNDSIGEYFDTPAHLRLLAGLEQFKRGQAGELHVTTNLGDWFCDCLTEQARTFIKPFYNFVPAVTTASSSLRGNGPYEVLSIRCGNRFFGNHDELPPENDRNRVVALIEREILPTARAPVVIMSDCLALKTSLARRFGFRVSPLLPEHSGRGTSFSTCMDLDLLRHSSQNHHINLWAPWWSGFSHFTSLIFSIPSANWRHPDFVREEVSVRNDNCHAMSQHAQMAWRLVESAEIQRASAQRDADSIRSELLASSREHNPGRDELNAALKKIRSLQKILDKKSSQEDRLKSRISFLLNRWTWLGWRLMPWTKPSWRHHPFDG